MGTKDNPGRFDCYGKAEPDEPMMVLLARDPDAAVLTRVWALLRHRRAAEEDAEQITEALVNANAMDAWRRRKRPHAEPDDNREQALLFAATEGMLEHPEDYDCSCDCDLCRSYE